MATDEPREPAPVDASAASPADGAPPPAANDARPAASADTTATPGAPLADPVAAPPAPNSVPVAPAASAPPPVPPPRRHAIEPEEIPIEAPRRRLAMQSRRDFLLFGLGVAATAIGGWWLLPPMTRARLAGVPGRDRLDTLAARIGLGRAVRDRALDRALTFDDDVAEALFSTDRRVRTYTRRDVTPLRNNYDGQTPGPEYLATWALTVTGLASGRTERLPIDELLRRFPLQEQVTRLVCVEGWSAIAWWQGIRFRDFLDAYPPAPGTRWASLRSAVNLDGEGNRDPYYVSIDLPTARHPQSLLATHQNAAPLTLAHGAPMRLLVPMKLGLKNIKAVTEIAYSASEPADYWNERGYSKYDGL